MNETWLAMRKENVLIRLIVKWEKMMKHKLDRLLGYYFKKKIEKKLRKKM